MSLVEVYTANGIMDINKTDLLSVQTFRMGDHFSDRTRTILEVVWITVAVVGFILNTAQICWILSRSRKSVIDVFIVSLAVIDLQTCCFNIPFQVAELFHAFDWSYLGSYAQLACQFHWYFRHGSVVSGSIIMSLIAVSRYIAISHPMRRIKRKCSQTCINSALALFTWIITVALIAPVASMTATINVNYQLVSVNSTIADSQSNDTEEVAMRVVRVCEQKEKSLGPVIYGSILFFVVPLVIMCFSYVSLITVLIKRKQKNVLVYQGNSKHFRKSIVNCCLGLGYIILVAPKGIYDIIKIARYNGGHDRTTTTDGPLIDLILYVLATAVVISNPVIYSFLTPRFFKFVEQHSQQGHMRYPFNKMDSLYSVWSNMDWSKPSKLQTNRFLSHENLHTDSKKDKHVYRQETVKTIMFEAELGGDDCTDLDPEKLNDIEEYNTQNYHFIEKYPMITAEKNMKKMFRRIATTGRAMDTLNYEEDEKFIGSYATL